MSRKPQIKVPFRWKELSSSYRYGFGHGYSNTLPKFVDYFQTAQAARAYEAGFDAGQKKREREGLSNERS